MCKQNSYLLYTMQQVRKYLYSLIASRSLLHMEQEGKSTAIEIKGIVRNQTKIGVQDGQCDDLVNLRFKNGSWRVADDGRVMRDVDSERPFVAIDYSQLYVHTNVYHHLLGVKKSKLYWFANIDADGESFTFVKNNVGVPTPVEICDVQGNVTIVQNGHLLTIISTNSDTTPLPLATSTEEQKRSITYAIFKTGTNEYKELKVNPNGEQTDRTLYPFGRVHLNLNCDYDSKREFIDENQDAGYIAVASNYNSTMLCSIVKGSSGMLVPKDDESTTYAAAKLWHSSMLKVFNEAKENNYFTSPFIAIVTIDAYDGTPIYTSNPIFLNPRERYSLYEDVYDSVNGVVIKPSDKETIFFQRQGAKINSSETVVKGNGDREFYACDIGEIAHYNEKDYCLTDRTPVYFNGARTIEFNYQGGASGVIKEDSEKTPLVSVVLGSTLLLTLGDINTIVNNNDVFSGISVYITKESYLYDMSAEGYKGGKFKLHCDNIEKDNVNWTICGNVTYKPKLRDRKEIIHELLTSPFYLLRKYNTSELQAMNNTTIEVDLQGVQYKGVLSNIEQQDVLAPESLNRKDNVPQVAYQYNQKLHIANYQTKQYHGFPIDCFHMSNHNLKISNGNYAIGGVLPNVEEGVDFQYSRDKIPLVYTYQGAQDYVDLAKEVGSYFAMITVEIETQQGTQKVVRYIAPYDAHKFNNGDNANFIEELSPLLTFPDSRAKSMEIRIAYMEDEQTISWIGCYCALKPHQYLNLAYYINPTLEPISFHYDFTGFGSIHILEFADQNVNYEFIPPKEINNIEDFPNGLKVSLANNPFTFPYESTYQVGSSEIVALMSNAVAIGTGQTGTAPLYVFCKDGIYALMVDSTGEMTYTNARIVARDVCNNAKSVTPIDSGVVFTTDRGLMSISGSEVVEIGSAAEGDVFDITDTSDKAKKIMFNAFTMLQLAEFPQSLIDNTDFLTYLKGAIVNYNHNERELMVSNPSKDYTYVMDRNGNWSRRAFTAKEYVNNYPTSYRIDNAGDFYKVDADDNDTNKVYLLSNIIKLGTIAFKQAYRLVVRGYFETEDDAKLGLYVFGSYDGRQWALLGGNEKDQTYNQGKFTDIGCKISHTDIRFLRVCLAGKLSKNSRIDYIEVSLDGSMLNGKLR